MIVQHPEPGKALVRFGGDCITFSLEVSRDAPGCAWIRTDLGRARDARQEIIRHTEHGDIQLNEAWHDIRMTQASDNEFTITLPLYETGHFRAKCYFLPDNSLDPEWPNGKNTVINVHPPGSCCANIIYNAFVRQFGPSKWVPDTQIKKDQTALIESLEEKGYAVIPCSGKFRDLIKEIPFIFQDLGCRVLHLLPVHPTPTTYARMGRIGSPYAALSFTQVDPALAQFDPSATPLEQFMELSDAVHSYSGYIILDIAINHTGWAAAIHEKHPEWLVRGEDGKIEVPGAWGTKWEDLTKLDFSKKELWIYMADIFLLWCRRGVDGFRCDAGYMIPVSAWEYIVAKVRQEFPDSIFFLEGLGGPLKTTRDILNTGNFNWAYSELFQNYNRSQIENYLPGAYEISKTCGPMINFAETHDNPRLASVSEIYAKMRTTLCALFSVCGGFGFANGVEWFATQKINVHDVNSLNWGAENNQVRHIHRLNLILKTHRAFGHRTRLKLIQKGDGNCAALVRNHIPSATHVLVTVNLDCDNQQRVAWSNSDLPVGETPYYDLITKKQLFISRIKNDCFIDLAPGEVLALTPDKNDLRQMQEMSSIESIIPARVLLQKLKAKAVMVHSILRGYGDIQGVDPETEGKRLAEDPLRFCSSLNQKSSESRVVLWQWDTDARRTVMVPPGFFLLVTAGSNFRAMIAESRANDAGILGYEEGLPMDDHRFFALFAPQPASKFPKEYCFRIRVFNNGKVTEKISSLLYLAEPEQLVMASDFTRQEILEDPGLKFLGFTKKGGMMRAAAWWGKLESRYDALLAANLNPDYPENRWMFLSRYRLWAVFQGYSRELTLDCLEKFTFSYANIGIWLFRVPTSEGSCYFIELTLEMLEHRNSVRMTLLRKPAGDNNHWLNDEKPVTIIIRPDIEDRSFHDTVKAYAGPEEFWKDCVTMLETGFAFAPAADRCLVVRVSSGSFVWEPEWKYMVHRPLEVQRGLDPDSDLFSPGYFTATLKGNQTLTVSADAGLSASALSESLKSISSPEKQGQKSLSGNWTLIDAALLSLDAFIVQRQDYQSVIAGYPWFLDWGRDSLIFCRALIEAERFSEASSILKLFGRFEKNGTLPNMIQGEDAGNRETSDAPLWFFAACRELVEKQGDKFLDEHLGKRSVRQILIDMAHSLINGTDTGIAMDSETGLLYSPSHFTWMDTNFPAGSPRQGYPIEIQALWHYALTFLEQIDNQDEQSLWHTMANNVRMWIKELFYLDEHGYFSDCLHSKKMVKAKKAEPDDALRPNQLFLITLGVVSDETICIRTLESCMELLVPGGIRSLADRKVATPLAISYNDKIINDPQSPYFGTYTGDEEMQRKPAYHNGTAWTWPFPVFCEAWADVFGIQGRQTGLAWLGSSLSLLRTGCAGYIPEILDGDYPHTARGCDAQAWGASELARVWLKLSTGQ